LKVVQSGENLVFGIHMTLGLFFCIEKGRKPKEKIFIVVNSY
jgi:hypothetical protein